MREILFKAKRESNRKWVEGYYYKENFFNRKVCTALHSWQGRHRLCGLRRNREPVYRISRPERQSNL